MIIRLAEFPRDALAVTEGAADFVSRMDCPEIMRPDMAAISDGLAFLIGLDSFELWAAEHDGRVVGGIGLLFAPFPWDRSRTIMSEQFIWCASDAPKTAFLAILRHAEARRVAMNAVGELTDLTSSPETIANVYRKMGYRIVQRSWMKAA